MCYCLLSSCHVMGKYLHNFSMAILSIRKHMFFYRKVISLLGCINVYISHTSKAKKYVYGYFLEENLLIWIMISHLSMVL